MAIFTRTRQDETVAPTTTWPSTDVGHGGGTPLRRVRRSMWRRWGWLLAAATLLAGVLTGVEVGTGTSTYPVSAVFARAPGLFPGAAVEVVGVPVGTVTSVRNVGDEVKVGLAIDHGRAIPATATASLVSPEILGEPSIDLAPGYTGGPALGRGAVIPMSRTAVPVSTEQVLRSLETYLKRVNPHAVGDLVTNLAQDFQGQGKNLHQLISGAAGTLKLLATKANDLGQLDGALAQLTGTLDSRSAQITQLISDYDTVSGVIAQHGAQLGGAISQLSAASTQLVKLLVPNLAPLESDIGTVTTVGRTIDRNLTSIDQILSASTTLFTGARRVYTSTYNWLTLNSQMPAGLTGAILAGMVRDRLAGVCRRILAHHAAGLTSKDRQTLATCGTPASSFFDPIIGEVPTILNDVRAGKLPTPTSPAQMLHQGLDRIPGVGTSPPSNPKETAPASAPRASSPGSSSTTAPTSSTPTSTAKTCLGGLLHTAIECSAACPTTRAGGTSSGSAQPPTTNSTTPGSTTPTASTADCTSSTPKSATTGTSKNSGGLGGLLSYDVPAAGSHGLASGTARGPSLRGPSLHGPSLHGPSLSLEATRELPPLPMTAPGAHRRRSRPSSHLATARGVARARRRGASRVHRHDVHRHDVRRHDVRADWKAHR